MTVSPALRRAAVPAPRPPAEQAAAARPVPRALWRDRLRTRLRERAALRREEQAFARAFDRAPTPSSRAELLVVREYGRR